MPQAPMLTGRNRPLQAACLCIPLLLASTAIVQAGPIAKACGPNDHYVIGFSQANYAEPYRQHVNNDLIARAKAIPQFELLVADGAGNDNTQTSQVDNFITQKVDLLMISPFEAAPLTPAVGRAVKAGIPVIELDRKTVGDPGKEYTAFVGGDNYKIAYEAGTYTAKTLLPEGGEVAVLEGLPSSTPAVERLNGFKDGVKQNPKIEVVAEQAADWLPDKAETAFAAMLQAHPDIKVVYASNDLMAAGAYLAAKGAGKAGPDRDHRHRRPARPGRRHRRGRLRPVGSHLHLPDRRRGIPGSRQEDSPGLRRIGAHDGHGADACDHPGQRQGAQRKAQILTATPKASLPFPHGTGQGRAGQTPPPAAAAVVSPSCTPAKASARLTSSPSASRRRPALAPRKYTLRQTSPSPDETSASARSCAIST